MCSGWCNNWVTWVNIPILFQKGLCTDDTDIVPERLEDKQYYRCFSMWPVNARYPYLFSEGFVDWRCGHCFSKMLVQFSNISAVINKHFNGDNSKHSTVYTSTTFWKLMFTDKSDVVLIICYLPIVEGRRYFRGVWSFNRHHIQNILNQSLNCSG